MFKKAVFELVQQFYHEIANVANALSAFVDQP